MGSRGAADGSLTRGFFSPWDVLREVVAVGVAAAAVAAAVVAA